MKKTILFIIAMVFACGVNAQTVAEVQTKFNAAAAAFNEKKFAESATMFEEVISMGDMAEGDVTTFVDQSKKLLYTSYMNAGKMKAGGKDFTAGLKYFRLAEASTVNLLQKNNAKKMITACNKAMVGAEIKAGDMAGAAAVAYEGYTSDKRDYTIGLLAAQCYAKSGDVAKADVIYAELIALSKTSPRLANVGVTANKSANSSHLALAIAALNAKDYAKALTCVEAAAKYLPNNAITELARIQILNDSKNYAKVVEFGPKAVTLQATPEKKSAAAFFVAIAYQELAQLPKAIEYYKQVTAGANAATAAKLVTQLTAQMKAEAAAKQ